MHNKIRHFLSKLKFLAIFAVRTERFFEYAEGNTFAAVYGTGTA